MHVWQFSACCKSNQLCLLWNHDNNNGNAWHRKYGCRRYSDN
uniref:Uncharacterized protein n=1 Tax=Siphoviridae sp. ctETQ12 TaxID=2826206 RepID=A0A8S5M744_9CAUD|nr:MAG TPA: hypothetical protein [Siphoviridae sp. ctETQ12]